MYKSLFIIFLIVLFIILIYYSKPIERYNNIPDLDNCYYYIKKNTNRTISQREKEVLYDLDAVKAPQNMLTTIDMQFTGGCAINPNRDLDYLKPDINCKIKGEKLLDEIDDNGYKKSKPINLNLLTQTEYAFPDVIPKYSCYIDSSDKNKFFEIINNIADIKFYERDLSNDKNKVELTNAKNLSELQ